MFNSIFNALKKGALFSAALFFITGCSTITDNKESMAHNDNFASLTVKTGSVSRSMDIDEIVSASISIFGTDFDDETKERLSDISVNISGGKNSDKIILEKIPVGKNRIVTVKALDSDGNELSLWNLRAVTDIQKGEENQVTVSKSTTSYGNVIWELKDFFSDLSDPGETTSAELEKLRAAVDTTVNPCLFDYKNLTESYKAFSPLQDKSYYLLTPASYTFNYLLDDDFTVHVDDPVSEDVHYAKAGNERTVSNIAPGTWNLYIKDSNGNILTQTEITVKSGVDQKITHLPYNGIAVVMRGSKNYDHLYYWSCSDSSIKSTSWPGDKFAGTVAAENAEDDSYYVQKFSGITSIKCLVTNSSGDKYHADDIILSAPGVYCVHYDSVETLTDAGYVPPEDFKLSNFDITDENYRTFYYDDAANKRIIMLFNPDTWNYSSVSSAKVYFNSGINDTTEYSGNSYSFTKDDSGTWYALVPYSEIRATNQSGQPTYKLTVNDSTFDVVSKLNSSGYNGYVYTKYSSKTAGTSLPVIIYSRQNKEKVTAALAAEKTEKSISNFDLSSDEGQQQIANFRLVPGTTKLYRSYHPYIASKSEFSTEPYRLYYVAKLAEKYGIQSDIQVGSETAVSTKTVTVYDGSSGTKSVDNYLPSYYENIKKNNNVFFLLSEYSGWGYDIGYFNTKTITNMEENSKTFAKCIGYIIKFVNEHPGPYQTHCSIGTDRTGTTCGVIAAMCGASYSEIEEDYCSSQNMGIYEFRGPGCIRYTMEEFLRITDIDDTEQVPDLQAAVIQRLVDYGGVTETEINTAIERLGGTVAR